MDKICPIMSGVRALENGDSDIIMASCQGSKCRLWIQPYTTEMRLLQEGGCSLELAPMMDAGLYRV